MAGMAAGPAVGLAVGAVAAAVVTHATLNNGEEDAVTASRVEDGQAGSEAEQEPASGLDTAE